MKNLKELLKDKSIINSENIFYLGLGWSAFALLFFLLYSVPEPGEATSSWYLRGTYVWEMVAFLAAALLCFRNWLIPNVASGKKVWQLMGIGMILFFIGDVFFGIWELYFGLEPDVSPADFFYLAFYVFVGWGIILAVIPRRLNLSKIQLTIIAVISFLGVLLAIWTNVFLPENVSETIPITYSTDLPAWILNLDKFLRNFSGIFSFLYIIFDVALLILASALLLAFWGGRLAQPWRMIAAASFCLYIADMSVHYADVTAAFYESGNLLEVFFVFSGVLFALGAVREYDLSLSSRSHRNRRKKSSGL